MFLGQQNSAHDAGMESDLVNMKVAEVSYETANAGTMTTSITSLAPYGYTATTGATSAPTVMLSSTSGNFCVSGESASGTWFAATQSLGAAAGYCGANAVFRNYQPTFTP